MIRRLFRLGTRSAALTREDAEAELRSYIAARVEQLTARGWSPTDAQTEALRRLGGSFDDALAATIQSAQRRERHMDTRLMLDGIRSDIRFAFRSLRREKLLTTFVVVTLALGIGANAAMFGLVDRLLVRGPEHIEDPSAVMRFYRTVRREPQGDVTTGGFGWVSYDVFRKNTKSFNAVAAYTTGSFTYGQGLDAELVTFGAASYDLFPLLGVRPYRGRFFNTDEDAPGSAQPVVVLSYAFWQRAFGGDESDESAIGQRITLGATTYIIVGIAPRAFTGPQLAPVDTWIPLSLYSVNTATNWTTAWNAQWVRIIARLKPGVSREQANDDATSAYRGAYTGNDVAARTAKLWLGGLNSDARGKETPEVTISRWLVGVAAVVLLIACANVANLLLARAVRRRREVAVRLALGAGRGRLVRLLLTESLILAGGGAAAGLAVAWIMARLMRTTLLPGLEWPSAPVDGRVLTLSIALALVVGIVTGLVPAMRASRPSLSGSLKFGARGGYQSSRLRNALTVAQAALSVVLLVGAGLFVRSLSQIRALDLGIETDRVLITQLRYATPRSAPELARQATVLREMLVQARVLPSVERASVTIGVPFQTSFGQNFRIAGYDSIPSSLGGTPNINAVGDGYFETVGTKLLAGRTFTAADREGAEPVAIVNKAMVSKLWGGKSPVGECLYWSNKADSLNTCSRIIGVVETAHTFALREDPTMQYYIPFGQEKGFGGSSLLVRPKSGHEAETQAAVRRMIAAVDPTVSYVTVRSLQDSVEPQVRPWKLGATLFTLMGVLALVVAAVGLYSVMSYLVAQRTQEIGVRIALGAQSSSIVGLILRSSVAMASVGIAIGLGVSLGAGRYIEPLLFDTSPRDPAVLGGVAAVLIAIALLSSALPALRAKRVHPMEALRGD